MGKVGFFAWGIETCGGGWNQRRRWQFRLSIDENQKLSRVESVHEKDTGKGIRRRGRAMFLRREFVGVSGRLLS